MKIPVRTHADTRTNADTRNTMTHCVVLLAVTKCAAGKKFVPAENGTPSKCEVCASGTFNAEHDASTECAKHNACADSAVKDTGTASTDSVCEPGLFVRNP